MVIQIPIEQKLTPLNKLMVFEFKVNNILNQLISTTISLITLKVCCKQNVFGQLGHVLNNLVRIVKLATQLYVAKTSHKHGISIHVVKLNI